MGTIFCQKCGAACEPRTVEDRQRFVCPACSWVAYENPLPCTAAFIQNTKGKILLVQRGVEPCAGQWALPSGFLEIDETPEQGCLRELKEETGFEGKIEELIGVYDQASVLYKKVVIIGYRVSVQGRLKPGSDSLDARFFEPGRLPEIAFPAHQKMVRDALDKKSPGKNQV